MAAPPPLRLDDSHSVDGQWWLPTEPDRTAPGRLEYSPESGVELALSGAWWSYTNQERIALIHGLANDGRLITIRDSWLRNFRSSTPGTVSTRLSARDALVGMHADEKARITELAVEVSGLNEIIGEPKVDAQGSPPNYGSISFGAQSPLVLARTGGVIFEALTTFATDVERGSHFHATVEQRGWLRARPPNARPLDALDHLLWRGRAFASFLAGDLLQAKEIKARARVKRTSFGHRRRSYTRTEDVWVLRRRAEGNFREVQQRSVLFTLTEPLRGVGKPPMQRWMRRMSAFDDIYNLYLMSAPASSAYLHVRFTNYVQGLEALHAARFGKAALDKRINRLIDDLPAGVRRLIPDAYTKYATITRHYYTHWDPRQRTKALHDEDLVALMFATKVLLEMSLLRALGIGRRELHDLVNSQQRMVWEFQRGFLQLGQRTT